MLIFTEDCPDHALILLSGAFMSSVLLVLLCLWISQDDMWMVCALPPADGPCRHRGSETACRVGRESFAVSMH